MCNEHKPKALVFLIYNYPTNYCDLLIGILNTSKRGEKHEGLWRS